MKLLITIVLMALLILAVTFSQQNTEPVSIRYFGLISSEFKIASYLLIFLSFFAGIVFAGLIGIVERFRLGLKVSKLKKEIKTLESELYECKKQVISGGPPTPPLSDQNLL